MIRTDSFSYKILAFRCIFLAFVLVFVGCTVSGPKATTSLENVVATHDEKRQDIKQINDRLFASVSNSPQAQADYVISEGDLLEVKVYEDGDLNKEARVGAQGTVTLPLVGTIRVRGMTTGDAEKQIQNAYAQGYLKDPHVSIFVKEQRGSQITLVGEVQKPGTYDYFGRKHLLDALAIGGGLSEKAGKTVQVRRNSEDPNRPMSFVIDLDQLANKGMGELNIAIEGGDVIYVPEAGMVYVDGSVQKAGAYPIKQNMSVGQAIVAAGGFTPAASSTIKLVRISDSGNRDVIKLSANSPDADNLQVQDCDVVFVEANPVKSALYGFHFTFFGTGVAISPAK